MKSELAIAFEDTSLELGGNNLIFDFNVDASFSIEEESQKIPSSVFLNDSGLRGIVRYLHDEKKMTFSEIASSLKRHINTVRTSYEKSKPLTSVSGEYLPVRIFAKHSPLGAASLYFAQQNYRLKDIAMLLGRDSKTIWTVLNRLGWKQ